MSFVVAAVTVVCFLIVLFWGWFFVVFLVFFFWGGGGGRGCDTSGLGERAHQCVDTMLLIQGIKTIFRQQ